MSELLTTVPKLEIGQTKEKPKKIIVPEEPVGISANIRTPAYSQQADSLNFGIQYDSSYTTDRDMINTYRELSQTGYVDYAIQDICNESIVIDGKKEPIQLNLDEFKKLEDNSLNNDKILDKIQESFSEILNKLDFNRNGEEIFRKWYVDGRIYAYMSINKDRSMGIDDIRIMDPRYTKKIYHTKHDNDGNELSREIYYIYFNPDRQNKLGVRNKAIKIPEDNIIYIDSGIYDKNGNALSYLHKSIIPANQLNDMEESMIIYRLARAPERRVFYIDVGELPKTIAEQHLNETMQKYKNKMVYDVKTGKMKDSRHMKSILEDVWLTRRDGSRGTEMTTQPGAQNLGQIDDIELLKKKLYRSLSVPYSRLNEESLFSFGNPGEFTQDEYKLSRLTTKLRNRFVQLLNGLLKTQILLKNIMGEDEFEKIKNSIHYVFAQDTMFSELKNLEMLKNRLEVAQNMLNAESLFPRSYIYKEAMKMSDEDIKNIEQLRAKEKPDNNEEDKL